MEEKKRKKSRTIVAVGIIAIAVLAFAAIAGWYMFAKTEGPTEKPKNNGAPVIPPLEEPKKPSAAPKITGTLTMSPEAAKVLIVKHEFWETKGVLSNPGPPTQGWVIKIEIKNIGNATIHYGDFIFEIISKDKNGKTLKSERMFVGDFEGAGDGLEPKENARYSPILFNSYDVVSYEIKVLTYKYKG